jgi:hypothetical protein
MQTIRVRSRVGADGNLQLQLPKQLANQEIDVVLVYQSVNSTEQTTSAIEDDQQNPPQPPQTPLEALTQSGFIGCGSAKPDLSVNYKVVLQEELEKKYDHR